MPGEGLDDKRVSQRALRKYIQGISSKLLLTCRPEGGYPFLAFHLYCIYQVRYITSIKTNQSLLDVGSPEYNVASSSHTPSNVRMKVGWLRRLTPRKYLPVIFYPNNVRIS